MRTLFTVSRTRALQTLVVVAQIGAVPILLACSDDASNRGPAARVAGPGAGAAALAKNTDKGTTQRRIAFIGPYNKLHTMKPDGSDVIQLAAANAIEDESPAWSPDYTKIVFTTNRGGSLSNVFTVNADMTGLTQITSGIFAKNPSFSADGSKIVFQTASLTGNWDIWVKDLGTGDMTQLTTNPAGDAEPRWSPDGTRIAFTSLRDGHSEVYVMNADGTQQNRLTYCGTDCYGPAWSPDGTRIAFTGNVFGQTIFVTAANEFRRYLPVTLARIDPTESNHRPTWSPDGKKVAFESRRNGATGIYVANIDGSGLTSVTLGLYGSDPAWSW